MRMGAEHDAYQVNCPFYKDHRGNHIKCESLFGSQEFSGSTVCTFINEKVRNEHMKKFCKLNYRGCRLYKAILSMKYPETK